MPVAEVLMAQRQIESVLMTQGVQIGRRCTFAQHLRHRIAGYEVNQQKDQGNYQPDNRKRVQQTAAQRGQQLHAPPRAGSAGGWTAAALDGTGSMRTRPMRCPLISATV